ncbi:zinc-binding dehydrogenase [Salinirubrum litoreum]|uniref:Zinc-binding dehydrogenase n=1 Tax=Salinirubrum litoreum TaxID=1126234 RepID=A0ABD5RGV0_9EURY|nr:zinc-binding dehydrogenase [Salinirubrum litoreum]
MRAAQVTQLGSPEEAISVVDVETPEPGPGEVRLRVEACALNRLDVFARLGHPDEADIFPKRTGGDVAGTVDAVGDDVTDWAPGESAVVYPIVSCGDCEYCLSGEQTMCASYEIIGEDRPGGLAEFVVVPAETLDPLPGDLDFVTAAAYPVAFTTAWRMIVTAGGLRPAESALVLGASGGVGNAAARIAAFLGATVYATTSTAEKAEALSEIADEVIDYTAVPFDEAVADLTDARGVDLVADHVGQETWQTSIDSLATGGRMVICGATSGATPDLDIRSVYQHHRQILGAPMGNRTEFRTVGRLVGAGDLEPCVDRVLPLERVFEGHRVLETRDVVGKVVIRPGQ